MNITLFWNGWTPIVHGALIATVGYLVLVLLLRVTGPRTMSKMTPLDFVIAVTLGSAFGRTITAQQVSLVQAVWVLLVLVALQWALAWARARSERVRGLVDHPPVVLYADGRPVQRALRRHRLVESDLHEAARSAGHGSLEQVHTVLLMREGSLGVVTYDNIGDASSIRPFTQRGHA
ncbi:hypothetical protein SGUI_1204 [Serinicoccus hydrothermalis]|uniref:Membrane protein yetF n=1 Tax=Serinicoccus hydrothermalis TaxID=1758689 RepID=A0A1B1NAZ2_9MICO|nr:YetF domain-containing protein [Serinicoccus hydrothermalis]ANS78600.1 hypothetical protein SGUI_1204 [Serinicoccus hydrothermalis]